MAVQNAFIKAALSGQVAEDSSKALAHFGVNLRHPAFRNAQRCANRFHDHVLEVVQADHGLLLGSESVDSLVEYLAQLVSHYNFKGVGSLLVGQHSQHGFRIVKVSGLQLFEPDESYSFGLLEQRVKRVNVLDAEEFPELVVAG